MPISWLDIILIVIMLISGFLAMVRGFTREVLSVFSWAVAAVLSAKVPAETGTVIVPGRTMSPPLTSTVKRSSPPSTLRVKSVAVPMWNGPVPLLMTATRAVVVRTGFRLARGP